MLCGWYHAISFAANGVGLDMEDGAPRFEDVSRPDHHTDPPAGGSLARTETTGHCWRPPGPTTAVGV